MENQYKIEDAINKLCLSLGIKQKHLASFLDISSESLSRLKQEPFDPNSETKIAKRLSYLFYAIIPLLEAPIEPLARLSTIRMPVFEDIHGNLDSVISAIKQDKYQKELLKVITEKAYSKLLEQQQSQDSFLETYKAQVS